MNCNCVIVELECCRSSGKLSWVISVSINCHSFPAYVCKWMSFQLPEKSLECINKPVLASTNWKLIMSSNYIKNICQSFPHIDTTVYQVFPLIKMGNSWLITYFCSVTQNHSCYCFWISTRFMEQHETVLLVYDLIIFSESWNYSSHASFNQLWDLQVWLAFYGFITWIGTSYQHWPFVS